MAVGYDVTRTTMDTTATAITETQDKTGIEPTTITAGTTAEFGTTATTTGLIRTMGTTTDTTRVRGSQSEAVVHGYSSGSK